MQRAGTTYVFLDESGNYTPARPLVVGAIVTEDAIRVEEAVAATYEKQVSSPHYGDARSFEKFKSRGYHFTDDPLEIKLSFIDESSLLGMFRGFMVFSERERLPGLGDNARICVLYRYLLRDLLPYIRTTKVVFRFEQNAGVDHLFQGVAAAAVSDASRRQPKGSFPEVSVEIASKGEHLSHALVDYMMGIFSAWHASGQQRDFQVADYRNYHKFEANIGLIHNFDANTRSTRRHRSFK